MKFLIRREIEAVQRLREAKPIHALFLADNLKMLDEYGMPTSKAKIYKLTSSGEILHRRYRNKLVFSRKELDEWMSRKK